jgi:hypothetical protein
MLEADHSARLLTEVAQTLRPLAVAVRPEGDDFVADLVGDGHVVWLNYASAPDQLLATLAAEQRYLAEEVGAGSLPGESYVDKARERLRRALDAG